MASTKNDKRKTTNDASMERMPFFSIIVPVYNVAPYLRACLDSILAQRFSSWECICVDDGATDGSGEILDEYAAKEPCIHVIHQKNAGLSAARNRGIDMALHVSPTQYLTFIDADDWVAPNYLDVLYQGTLAQTGCVAVGVQRIYAHTRTIRSSTPVCHAITTPRDFWVTGCLPMTAWAKAFPKKYFAHKRFPEGRYHEDEATIHRILFQGQTLAITPEPLYYYRQRKSGIMGNASTPRALDLIAAHEDQAAFFVTQGFVELAHSVQFRLVYEYANAAWRLGQKECFHRLKQLLIANPRLTPFMRVNGLTLWLTAYGYYPLCRLCDILHRRGLLGTLKQFTLRFRRGT